MNTWKQPAIHIDNVWELSHNIKLPKLNTCIQLQNRFIKISPDSAE